MQSVVEVQYEVPHLCVVKVFYIEAGLSITWKSDFLGLQLVVQDSPRKCDERTWGIRVFHVVVNQT